MFSSSRLDANRELELATFGVPEAEDAFNNYTLFLETARSAVSNTCQGRGLFVDIHGQTHSEEWVELGYRITAEQLNDESYVSSDASIRALAETKCGSDVTCFHNLIKGTTSLGHFLQEQGCRVVPSPEFPGPGSGGYYRGGYNTEKYGSKGWGSIDAIQIEIPRFYRFGDWEAFALKLAQALKSYMELHHY